MTIAERRRQRLAQAKARDTMKEHYKEEPFTWNGYGGEITAYPCGCGQSFDEEYQQEAHIKAEQCAAEIERIREDHYDARANTR